MGCTVFGIPIADIRSEWRTACHSCPLRGLARTFTCVRKQVVSKIDRFHGGFYPYTGKVRGDGKATL